ncbi:hypothetical protein GL273_01275 [Aeromonas jandaei]|uniref:hypothetical protein n=1 Tax=Aeromonas jandaei TaxID=650 RepID=UPI001C5B778A|nr:hypothetical protein [Aeromonas jandaei]MBW3804458.1 hypothetical protein [Aeromonas jandaei]
MVVSAIKTMLTPLRLISFVAICICILIVYPFVNGMGCNFPIEIDNNAYHIVGSCRQGVVKYATHYKKTGSVAVRKEIYGVVGNKIITITVDKVNYVSPPSGFHNVVDILSEYNYTSSDIVKVYYWGYSNDRKQYYFLLRSNYVGDGDTSLLFKTSAQGRVAYIEPSS